MNWRKWLDDFVLAGKGVLLATRQKRFWYGFVPTFIFFGMLINLLAGGFSKFELMAAAGMPGALKILGNAFLSIFGINQIFVEWLPTFLLALLQGILVGLIVFLWKKKRETAEDNAAGVEKVGIITGLVALGAGCPTCGTTLLTPLLGAIFSTGSLAIAGAISAIVTALAVVIGVLSLKKLGVETYAIIINEKYLRKKAEKQKALQSAEKQKALQSAGKQGKSSKKEVKKSMKKSMKKEENAKG